MATIPPPSQWGLDPLLVARPKLLISHIFGLSTHPSIDEILGYVVVTEHYGEKKFNVTIDDGSGVLNCTLWLKDASPSSSSAAFKKPAIEQARTIYSEAACKLGALVRVTGRLVVYKDVLQMNIDSIIPEPDVNAIMLFWLECEHLMRTIYSKPAVNLQSILSSVADLNKQNQGNQSGKNLHKKQPHQAEFRAPAPVPPKAGGQSMDLSTSILRPIFTPPSSDEAKSQSEGKKRKELHVEDEFDDEIGGRKEEELDIEEMTCAVLWRALMDSSVSKFTSCAHLRSRLSSSSSSASRFVRRVLTGSNEEIELAVQGLIENGSLLITHPAAASSSSASSSQTTLYEVTSNGRLGPLLVDIVRTRQSNRNDLLGVGADEIIDEAIRRHKELAHVTRARLKRCLNWLVEASMLYDTGPMRYKSVSQQK